MKRLSASLLALVFCLIGSLCQSAELNTKDWPQWRGLHRDGISDETGLNHKWGEEGPPLAWKVSGLGGGFASISIAGDKIFTMGDREKEQFVEALDRADGHMLWSTKISDAWKDKNYLGPRCTPTISDGRAYAVGTYGDLVCLDCNDGKILWRKNFEKDFGGKMMSGWGFSESPLVDGDKLVCTPGGAEAGLVALDKKTGAEIWRSKIPVFGESGKDGAAYSSIVISEGAGVRQYVQLMGRGVVSVDAKTGKFLWGYNKIANKTANIPTPIINGDEVFCSTGYGTGAALLKLHKTSDGVEAEEIYFLDAKTLQNHHGGMVLVGDYLYGGTGHNNGFPICVEWSTGKVKWNGGRGPGSNSAAVVYADGYFYLRYQNGVVAQIKATPDSYQLEGQFQIPDNERPSWPHPVILSGKLYLREQDMLYCYDLKK
jgi:outer membrane protein assembly factor BamB